MSELTTRGAPPGYVRYAGTLQIAKASPPIRALVELLDDLDDSWESCQRGDAMLERVATVRGEASIAVQSLITEARTFMLMLIDLVPVSPPRWRRSVAACWSQSDARTQCEDTSTASAVAFVCKEMARAATIIDDKHISPNRVAIKKFNGLLSPLADIVRAAFPESPNMEK